ncbi:MAG: orotidine-5'-phosphate decarboxylase [Deltaproteobacteria bacterium]|nr:orotidine-5'-phosphate decarboxylase [Deltaproteobacteria bacterium]MCB9787384.1 orotidine-5'-phosphate decarboxylase [Deltaproteobacteria bacterium]
MSAGLTPTDRLIVALDAPDGDAARALIAELRGTLTWFKVGMTLYYGAGRAIVDELVASGERVFLDLKCHDIPHQVEGAVRGLAQLGVALVTVHTGGGPAMLEAAARAVEGTSTRVLGVTVLTSLDADALAAVGIVRDPGELVLERARLAAVCGLHGVVASPQEARALRAALPAGFEIVTPGIRPASAPADDQRRTATPAQAIRAGATRLVVGRPITTACEPAMAARALLREIEAAR